MLGRSNNASEKMGAPGGTRSFVSKGELDVSRQAPGRMTIPVAYLLCDGCCRRRLHVVIRVRQA